MSALSFRFPRASACKARDGSAVELQRWRVGESADVKTLHPAGQRQLGKAGDQRTRAIAKWIHAQITLLLPEMLAARFRMLTVRSKRSSNKPGSIIELQQIGMARVVDCHAPDHQRGDDDTDLCSFWSHSGKNGVESGFTRELQSGCLSKRAAPNVDDGTFSSIELQPWPGIQSPPPVHRSRLPKLSRDSALLCSMIELQPLCATRGTHPNADQLSASSLITGMMDACKLSLIDAIDDGIELQALRSHSRNVSKIANHYLVQHSCHHELVSTKDEASSSHIACRDAEVDLHVLWSDSYVSMAENYSSVELQQRNISKSADDTFVYFFPKQLHGGTAYGRTSHVLASQVQTLLRPLFRDFSAPDMFSKGQILVSLGTFRDSIISADGMNTNFSFHYSGNDGAHLQTTAKL